MTTPQTNALEVPQVARSLLAGNLACAARARIEAMLLWYTAQDAGRRPPSAGWRGFVNRSSGREMIGRPAEARRPRPGGGRSRRCDGRDTNSSVLRPRVGYNPKGRDSQMERRRCRPGGRQRLHRARRCLGAAPKRPTSDSSIHAGAESLKRFLRLHSCPRPPHRDRRAIRARLDRALLEPRRGRGERHRGPDEGGRGDAVA